MTETMSKNHGSLYPFSLPVFFITLLVRWQISVSGFVGFPDKIDVYRQSKLQTFKHEQFMHSPFLFLVTGFLPSKKKQKIDTAL
jgi:hypothetical protein